SAGNRFIMLGGSTVATGDINTVGMSIVPVVPCGPSSPTATNTPAVTATPTCVVPINYNYTLATGASPVPVTGARIDVGCDDCTTSIPTLPFPFTLYGTTYTAATVGSNGILAFGTANNAFQAT